MAEIIDDVKEFSNLTKQYLDVKLEIAKNQAKITISDIVSSLIIGMVLASLIGGSMIILSFGLAYTIGNNLGNTAYGFYAVGLGYLVISIALFFLGKAFLKNYIQNEIISKLDKDL
jgi:hypothetical protein